MDRTDKIKQYVNYVKTGRLGAPVSLHVAITDHCFNSCLMCRHRLRKKKNIMKVVEWTNFLTWLRDPVETVCYTGGDPFCHTDFNILMDWHIKKDFPFGVVTSGYLPPTIDLGLLSQAKFVSCSLDAIDPDVYKLVRGDSVSVGEVLDGIEKMVLGEVTVRVRPTIHKANEGEQEKIEAWCEERGIEVKCKGAYHGTCDGADPEGNPFKFRNCYAVFYQLYIGSDGDVFPCCLTNNDVDIAPLIRPFGNVFSDPWSSIWKKAVEHTKLNKMCLPYICSHQCIDRFSEINNIHEQLKSRKEFF